MDYIKEFLNLNLKDYPNIQIDLPIGFIVCFLLIGLAVSAVFINIYKVTNTKIIRRLLRRGAVSENGALTLSSLNINTFFVRRALSASGGKLTSIVKEAGKSVPTYEEVAQKGKKIKASDISGKIDFSSARFYIDENSYEAAKEESDKGSYSYLPSIIISLIYALLLVLSVFLLKDLISLINGFLA